MTQNSKQYILKNLKWPFSSFRHMAKYVFVIIPITILFYAGINEYMKGNSFNFALLGISIALLLAYVIEIERKFIEINLKNNYSTNEVGKKLAEKNFIIISEYDGVLEVRTTKLPLSTSEEITIIKLPNKILINTQPSSTFPVTLKNRVNYNLVKKILEN